MGLLSYSGNCLFASLSHFSHNDGLALSPVIVNDMFIVRVLWDCNLDRCDRDASVQSYMYICKTKCVISLDLQCIFTHISVSCSRFSIK